MVLRILSILAFAITMPDAMAGTISSGGGRIYRFENNPWFLENTSTVRYCVDVDEAKFGVDYWTLVARVEFAIQQWQSVFTIARDDLYASQSGSLAPFGAVRVGTQEFVRVTCDQEPELRFQFGTLTPSQKDWMDDPANYVGIAVRTDYDLESLSSRGFVYLAPISGPLRPSPEAFSDEVWTTCDHCILDLVLQHEIGHIFGIAHSHDLGRSWLMHEQTPMSLAKQHVINSIKRLQPDALSILRERSSPQHSLMAIEEGSFSGCDLKRPIHARIGKIWNIPPEDACVDIRINAQTFEIYSTLDRLKPMQLRGRVKFLQAASSQQTALVSLWLPPEQKVFSNLPPSLAEDFGFVSGELVTSEWNSNGVYEFADGSQSFPVRFVIGPTGLVEVLFVHQNEFYESRIYLLGDQN